MVSTQHQKEPIEQLISWLNDRQDCYDCGNFGAMDMQVALDLAEQIRLQLSKSKRNNQCQKYRKIRIK